MPLGAADEKSPPPTPLLEALGLAEVTHDARNNRMRARGDRPEFRQRAAIALQSASPRLREPGDQPGISASNGAT